MNIIFFDLESDGVDIDFVSKVHVLSYGYYHNGKLIVKSIKTKKAIKKLFSKENVYFCGHNILWYDLLVLKKLFNINLNYERIIDTYLISNYLYPDNQSHSLDYWSQQTETKKVKIDEWLVASSDTFKERCENDVRITAELYEKFHSKLKELYKTKRHIKRIIQYLSFKGHCMSMQFYNRWKVDLDFIWERIKHFKNIHDEKMERLKENMPPVYKEIQAPKNLFKKDKTLSKHGEKWYRIVKKYKGDVSLKELAEIKTLSVPKEPNPGSISQLKDWLKSLGWDPCTFKMSKTKDGEKPVPQIYDENKNLTPSVMALIDKNPELQPLAELSVIRARLNLLVKILKSIDYSGHVIGNASGLTNTLRFKHRTIVNLPRVTGKGDVHDGYHIRGALTADDGYILCGCDMVSLEDTTKRHFIKTYDPKTAEEMSRDDYDPHLKLALAAGDITEDDYHYYLNNKGNDKDERVKKIHQIRYKFKQANYSCVYGVGAKTLARNLQIPESEAKRIIQNYWKVNWAVKKTINNIKKKQFKDQDGTWLFNPISKFWIYCRKGKNEFAAYNSHTGVYCFDTFIGYVLSYIEKYKLNIRIVGQFHDEIILMLKEKDKKKCEEILNKAIDKTNKHVSLSVKLYIDYKFGKRYGDVH